MKLEMLRVFQITADQGSLARAAEVLGRTPSAVSMMLLQLEQDVGGALFQAGRKNRLTPLGALVLEESRRVNDAFDRSTQAIRRYALSTAGTVRIAAVPSATSGLLPPIIAAFQRDRPEVRLEISDVDSAAVRRRIRRDEADIGILSAVSPQDSNGTVILRDPLGIICRSAGAIATTPLAKDRCTWAALLQEPLILNPLCALVDSPLVRQVMLRSTLEARNTTALLAFVRAGLGATILPESAMRDAGEGLSFIEPADPPAYRHLHKICQPERPFSPAVSAFWDCLPAIAEPG